MREDHPEEYNGYPFITLLQYHREPILTIIDDSNDRNIQAYVLDLCGPESVDEEVLITIATEWFDTNSDRFPLSFEFSRQGMTDLLSGIYRTYNTDFITRVIGPLPAFNMESTPSIRRRRRKPVPPGIEVKHITAG
jgi:hypothetical protein